MSACEPISFWIFGCRELDIWASRPLRTYVSYFPHTIYHPLEHVSSNTFHSAFKEQSLGTGRKYFWPQFWKDLSVRRTSGASNEKPRLHNKKHSLSHIIIANKDKLVLFTEGRKWLKSLPDKMEFTHWLPTIYKELKHSSKTMIRARIW